MIGTKLVHDCEGVVRYPIGWVQDCDLVVCIACMNNMQCEYDMLIYVVLCINMGCEWRRIICINYNFPWYVESLHVHLGGE